MGRQQDPWNNIHNSNFWKNVKKLQKHETRIRLRPAANLAGIFKFPHGWLATEYDAIFDEDTSEFEKIWRKDFSSNVLGRSTFGEMAAKNAHSFRRQAVEGFLKRNLIREVIRYECLYVFNPKAPGYGRKPAALPANSVEFGELNVELSSIGRLSSKQHVIRVDPFDVQECLISEHETRGSRATVNRGDAERLARKLIETWQPTDGNSITKQTIIGAVADPETGVTADTDAKVATDDQIRPIVDELWIEYGLGK